MLRYEEETDPPHFAIPEKRAAQGIRLASFRFIVRPHAPGGRPHQAAVGPLNARGEAAGATVILGTASDVSNHTAENRRHFTV
ncbi:MAG: hypothetical protein AW08_02866 [Candidatus Accumulibacter adjunctus]|uniref:Uncharacterized protein n=1 Tax=Candidatus Accumulibacter adjunctus TaxID=1454001 RepID=A0A011MTD4_9PROT|nr:MAG: hypothetical protein AW08_02866 [Candidatus Accumulibacter adjunctus]